MLSGYSQSAIIFITNLLHEQFDYYAKSNTCQGKNGSDYTSIM